MEHPSYILNNDREGRVNQESKYGEPIIKASPGFSWISYKGHVNFEMLYKMMYEWLCQNGYQDVDGAKDKFEHHYYEKLEPDGMKSEIWIWWRTIKKSPDGNPYFDFRIMVEFQVLALKQDALVVDGNKFKMHQGEVNIFLRGFLDNAHKKDKEWKKSVLFKQISNWWVNKAYLSQIDEREDDLYDDINKFYAAIKHYLGLNNYHDFRKPSFHPEKGLPQYKL